MNAYYTSIEQSKKLLELGYDTHTADGFWPWHDKWYSEGDDWEGFEDYPRSEPYHTYTRKENDWKSPNEDIPCWSLEALMDLFPCGKDNPVFSLTRGGYDGDGNYTTDWFAMCESEDDYLNDEMTDKDWIECKNAASPVDAVFELIIELKNKNRL